MTDEPKILTDNPVPEWLKASYHKVVDLIGPDEDVLRLRLSVRCLPDQCSMRLWLSARTQDKARDATLAAMLALCADRQTYIRRAPWAETTQDFETDKVTHAGAARFTVLNRKGTAQMLSPETEHLITAGAAK